MKSITNNEPEKESTCQRRNVTETIQKTNKILDADSKKFIGMKSSVFGRNSGQILEGNGYSFSAKAAVHSIIYHCIAFSFAGVSEAAYFPVL